MLLDHFQRPWKGYRKVRKGVKKRISRHMQEIGTRNMAAYLDRVEEDPAVQEECLRRMTVSISRFFRERRLWEVLRDSLLPELVGRDIEIVRVWSAGCAGGEEPYGFRVVWEEAKNHLDRVPALDLLATDSNPENLDRAQRGVYTRGSLKEVDPFILKAWFDEKEPGKSYRIKPELKEQITWKIHNLLEDPPDRRFHILFLRNNLLTYYEGRAKTEAFHRITTRLVDSGYLIIGSHEKPPSEAMEFTRLTGSPHIYRKRPC